MSTERYWDCIRVLGVFGAVGVVAVVWAAAIAFWQDNLRRVKEDDDDAP